MTTVVIDHHHWSDDEEALPCGFCPGGAVAAEPGAWIAAGSA
jgi:hypothetical protein